MLKKSERWGGWGDGDLKEKEEGGRRKESQRKKLYRLGTGGKRRIARCPCPKVPDEMRCVTQRGFVFGMGIGLLRSREASERRCVGVFYVFDVSKIFLFGLSITSSAGDREREGHLSGGDRVGGISCHRAFAMLVEVHLWD